MRVFVRSVYQSSLEFLFLMEAPGSIYFIKGIYGFVLN